MAINPETQFPGKISPSEPDYPYGKARNITTPGDGTGTPWEAVLINDIWGLLQALLSEASVVPSGTPDNANVSQYLDALKTVSKDNIKALVLDGQTGYFLRPKGQLVFISDEADPTSHAIASGHVLNASDEGALEFLIKYSDAQSRQASAYFTRTVDTGAGVDDFPTARVINGIHVNSGSKGDTTPLVVYDGNSVGVCLGSTGSLPWQNLPLTDNMFFVGDHNNQLQVLTQNPVGEITIQGYDINGAAFNKLNIYSAETTFGVGDLLPEGNDLRSIGSATRKVKRVWATDAALDSLSLGAAVTYFTGTGSPEGVITASIGSIYTDQNGGVGTTLYVKEANTTGNTGWAAK